VYPWNVAILSCHGTRRHNVQKGEHSQSANPGQQGPLYPPKLLMAPSMTVVFEGDQSHKKEILVQAGQPAPCARTGVRCGCNCVMWGMGALPCRAFESARQSPATCTQCKNPWRGRAADRPCQSIKHTDCPPHAAPPITPSTWAPPPKSRCGSAL